MLRTRLSAAAVAPLLLATAGGALAAETADTAPEVSGLIVTAPKDEAYRAERVSSATKTDTPLRDVPQAITVVTDELIRDQSMRGMADVLRYVPGATMGQGEGHRDAPTLRGIASTADFFVDGVRDDVQYLRDLYNVERVEVLKGPNAMIFGRGGGGGVINRVSKKADWTNHAAATLEGGSWEHFRATADAGALLADGVSGRVVGLFEDSGSFRDFVNVERWGVTPSLGWRSGDGLTAQLSYEHFEDDRTVDRGIPSAAGRPSSAGRDTFFGDPDFSRSRTRVDLVNLAVEYEASETLVLRNRAVFGVYDKYYQNSYASGAVNGANVPLQAYSTDGDRRNLFNQTDVVWKAETGRIRHTLLAGVELGRQTSDNRRRTGFYGGTAQTRSVPFASPTLRNSAIALRASASDANNRVKAKIAALYVQDQVELTPQVQILAGLRFDSVDIDFHDKRLGGAVRDFSRKDEMWSPRIGVIYKPVEAVSVYGSYSVSHLPSSGDQFGSLSATTQAFKPEKFENLEAGLKWEINPDLLFTAAAYRLTRDNTTARDPQNPAVTILAGKQRSEGFEAGLAGRLTERWEVIASYGWQDVEIVSRTAACPAAGRCVAPLAPKHAASLWNKVTLTDRFAAGLGVVSQSKMSAALDGAVTLPGFTRVDAAVFVNLTDTLKAQVNVENLFDKRYFPTSHGANNILPGSPRAVRVSLTAGF